MVRRLAQPLTWRSLEREIAEQIISRPCGQERAKSFAQMLARRLKTGPAVKRGPKEKSFKEH